MADDEASAYQGTTKYPTPPDAETTFPTQKAKAGGGLLSRIWKKVFRIRGDDFEKRLQHISKEEAAVLARLKRRTQDWRKISAHIIVFSVMLEVIAVGYAIVMTRSLDLNWKTRAFRVSPMFLLPVLSFVAYSALKNFIRMRDCKDHKTLERLRAERQEKIYELKEKTNYYITQQLIQMYDPDPAAKAAAATVLASKLGADSGLKVHVADESKTSVPKGMSSDMEVMESSGLRNRKQKLARSLSSGSTVLHHSNEETAICEGAPEQSQPLIVEHHREQESTANDGGWVARIAALLVGEDPKQSFALICGNCRMHNGLAKEEDFPYITYYCPHCHALNRNKQMEEEPASVTNTQNEPFIPVNTSNEIGDCSCSPTEAAADIGSERIASADSVG